MDFDPQTWSKEVENRRSREFPNMADPTPVTRLFSNFRDEEISNLKLEFIRLRDDWQEFSRQSSPTREIKENGVIPADLTVADLLGPLANYL